MAPLGALSQSWVTAEASLPLGWQISGLWRFDNLWIALSEGPAFDDYLSGSGQHADRAAAFGGPAARASRIGDRMIGRCMAVGVLAMAIIGCTQQANSEPASAISLSTATPSPTEAAVSVACEAFGPDVGGVSTAEGYIEAVAFMADSGLDMSDHEAELTRKAIDALTSLAGRASGAEAEDLSTVAEAMSDAALSGGGYHGWSAAWDAFKAKYAVDC